METRGTAQAQELERLREQLENAERALAEERATAAVRIAEEEEQRRRAQEEEEQRRAQQEAEQQHIREQAARAEREAEHPAHDSASIAASLAKLTELVAKQQQQLSDSKAQAEARELAQQEELRRLQAVCDDLSRRQPVRFPHTIEQCPNTQFPFDPSSRNSTNTSLLPLPALVVLNSLPSHCLEHGNLRTDLGIIFTLLALWEDIGHHFGRLLDEYETFQDPDAQVQFLAAGVAALFEPLDRDTSSGDTDGPLTFWSRGSLLLRAQYDHLQIDPTTPQGRTARETLRLLSGLSTRQCAPTTPAFEQALAASKAGITHSSLVDYLKSAASKRTPSDKGSGKSNSSGKRTGASSGKKASGGSSDSVNPHAPNSAAPSSSDALTTARSGKSRSPRGGRSGTNRGAPPSSSVPSSGSRSSGHAAQNAAQDP